MGAKNIKNIIGLLLCATLFTACVKDKPLDPVAGSLPVTDEHVFVLCEGNFGNGDASLYHFDPKSNAVTGDVFSAANASGIGDVLQSMQRIGDKYFLCVNNSDKVIVLNRSDMKSLGTIAIPKPRYILPVNENKAYVSAQYSNKVYVINPRTMQQTGIITLPYQNTEGMVLYNGRAVVCTWDTACTNVYAIDTLTDQVVQTIEVSGAAPQEPFVDKSNRLWVLSGNTYKKKKAYFTVLNTQWQIEKSYAFPDNVEAVKPVFDAGTGFVYFIEVDYNGGTTNNGIYRMNVYDPVLPAVPFVAAKQFEYFWALGVHPVSGKVYVGNPKGFVQKGTVTVYDTYGLQTTQFDVGLGPGHFYFD